MRVISGKYKGRKLVAPKGMARPTLDRMKETLFNIVAPRLPGAVVLDLFAGSGQLAIESLSRGAEQAFLCDDNRDSVAAIKSNFDAIGVQPQLFVGDFRTCLQQIDRKLDVVFVDPPYKSGAYTEVLYIIARRQLLSPDGIVVCEHAAEDDLPCSADGLVRYDVRKMGTVKFSFYKRSEQ